MKLSNPSGGTMLATPTNSVIVVQDADAGLSFINSATNVCKNAGNIIITVFALNPSVEPPVSNTNLAPLSVGYATADGTALAGSDYQAVSGTICVHQWHRDKHVQRADHQQQPGAGQSRLHRETLESTGPRPVGAAERPDGDDCGQQFRLELLQPGLQCFENRRRVHHHGGAHRQHQHDVHCQFCHGGWHGGGRHGLYRHERRVGLHQRRDQPFLRRDRG